MSNNKYLKAERTFTFIRRWGWFLTLLITIGGLWFPKLGLLVPFIMLALMGMSFLKGKYWCGNFCFHGSLFDRILFPFSRNIKTPGFFRSWTVIFVIFILFMAGISARMFSAFQHYGGADFLDRLGYVFVQTYLVVTILGSILGFFINPRVWCNLCPMGTIQHHIYKLGKTIGATSLYDSRITVDGDKCRHCFKCNRVCPAQLETYAILFNKEATNEPECLKCYTCVKHCPVKAISIKKSREFKVEGGFL